MKEPKLEKNLSEDALIGSTSLKLPHLIHEFSIDSLQFAKVVNVEYFSEAARQFNENKKRGKPLYCLAPVGSKEYEDFWEEERRRCRDGYQVGDLWICGRYYHYLNYYPMMRVPKGQEHKKNVADKEMDFPSFWLIQYLWKHFQLIAHYGGTFCGVSSEGGEDIVCLKTRGAGFSYMDGHDNVYNYTFLPRSKSYIFAYSGQFLDGEDGIMPKIQEGLDFTNTFVGGYSRTGKDFISEWGHARYDKSEEPMVFKAGAKSTSGELSGFGSVIAGVLCDRALKIRGKRGRKVTIEEAGSFPTLEEVLSSSLALVSDGATKVGQRIMFGTGGEEGIGIQAVENVYWNPKAYGFMSFPDIFGGSNEKVGFFCPSYFANSTFINEDGTTDVKGAIEFEKKRRAEKEKVSSTTLDKHVAEYPFTPQEALKRLSNKVFNTSLVEARIKKIQTDKSITDALFNCDLSYNKKTEKIEQLPNSHPPVVNYPHRDNDDLHGCVVIKQQPCYTIVQNTDGTYKRVVPDGMYEIVVDTYGVDEALSKESLFSCYVYKKHNSYDNSFAGVPVAWFVARRNLQESCFEQALNLCRLYNAKISGEYNAQGQLLILYFKFQKAIRYVAETPVVEGKSIRKGFWEIVTTDTKRSNIKAFAEYLETPRGVEFIFDDTDVALFDDDILFDLYDVRNIDYIDDIGLLRECLVYKGQNADRISANSLIMNKIKESIHRETAKREEKQDPLLLSRFMSVEIVEEEDGFVEISNKKSYTINSYSEKYF